MRIAFLIIGFAAIAGCGSPPVPKPTGSDTDDAKASQGFWVVDNFEAVGPDQPQPSDYAKIHFKIDGDKGTVYEGTNELAYFVIKLESGKPTKEVDFIETEKDFKTDGTISYTKYEFPAGKTPTTSKAERARKVIKGIYKWDGEKMQMALPMSEKMARPNGFNAMPGLKGSDEHRGVVHVWFAKVSEEEAKKRASSTGPAPKPKTTGDMPKN